MADTKISALTDAGTLTGSELIPGVQSGANVKMTPAQIETYLDLGDAAKKDTGTANGTVAAGNDSRFPTADEKAALAGTGTPSASNKYVTENDIPASGGLSVGRNIVDTDDIETGDENTYMTFENAADKTLTVLKNFMAAGESMAIEQKAAGVFTLAAGSGVTLNGAKKSWGQYSVVTIYCRDATTDANIMTVIGGSA